MRLMPDIIAACAIVRENPSIWPFRAFPYGPLGLEARRAEPSEADTIRNFYLGVAAGMCHIQESQITAAFYCGPDCPKNRRDHLVQQLPRVRATVAAFNRLAAVQLVSVWAPKGEFRINDVFVMNDKVREAIPSAKLGLVPSGNWKQWANLEAYLTTIRVPQSAVTDLIQGMLAIGVSALVRESSQTRLVGVGVGDNESGLLFLHDGVRPPQVGDVRPDGNTYTAVENVVPGVWFYETS